METKDSLGNKNLETLHIHDLRVPVVPGNFLTERSRGLGQSRDFPLSEGSSLGKPESTTFVRYGNTIVFRMHMDEPPCGS